MHKYKTYAIRAKINKSVIDKNSNETIDYIDHNNLFSLTRFDNKISRNSSFTNYHSKLSNFDQNKAILRKINLRQNSNTIVVKDNEEEKEYSINTNDLSKVILRDIKTNKLLYRLTEGSRSNSSAQQNSRKDLNSLGKITSFRLPNFPFCRTCNK